MSSPEAVASALINRSDATAFFSLGSIFPNVNFDACNAWAKGQPITKASGSVSLQQMTTLQRRRAGLPPMAPHEIVPIAPGGRRVFALCADPALPSPFAIFYDLDAPMPNGIYDTLPPLPDDVALLGAILVKNESTSDFVPGVTLFGASGIKVFGRTLSAPVEGVVFDASQDWSMTPSP